MATEHWEKYLDVLKNMVLQHMNDLKEIDSQLLEDLQAIERVKNIEASQGNFSVLNRLRRSFTAGEIPESNDLNVVLPEPTGRGVVRGKYAPCSITNCDSIYEACLILADANFGFLRVDPAARAIMEAGLSMAKKVGSATSTIHRHLDSRPDLWKKTGKGLWVHLPTLERLRIPVPETGVARKRAMRRVEVKDLDDLSPPQNAQQQPT